MKACKTPCSAECPAGTDIPNYMAHYRKGDLEGAARILMQANPLPMMTSRVCAHTCQTKCNRCSTDEAVAIHSVERVVGDYILAHLDEFYKAPAKETGKKLTIGYQNRCYPRCLLLKRACDEGELGEIYYAKAHAVRRRAVPNWGVFLNEYEQGGGPLIDIGTHALDLTLWTMNNYKPKYCVGTTYHKLNKDTDQGNAWGNWDPEKFTVEDSAFGFIVMENGATIVLESSWAINMLDTREAITTVCGTKAGGDMIGGVRINGIRQNRQYELTPNFKAGGAAFNDAHGSEQPAEREERLWIEAVRGGAAPITKPEQAFVVTQILEGIYESAKTGKPFYFDSAAE